MPFVKCPECGKLNSVKLKNCPKCEASLDMARASYNPDTQPIMPGAAANAAAEQPVFWGQPVQQQPQNNPWGQPVQQHAPQQPQNNPWGQPVQQHVPQQSQNNPWGQPVQQHVPQQSQNNTAWGQPISQNTATVTHCPTCGNQIITGTRFCGACGTPIAVQHQQPAGIPTRKNPYCL